MCVIYLDLVAIKTINENIDMSILILVPADLIKFFDQIATRQLLVMAMMQ